MALVLHYRPLWRSTTETADVYKIAITPDCIRAVYLGLAIGDSDRQMVMDAVGRFFPDAEVWRATRHGDLCLDFQPRTVGE